MTQKELVRAAASVPLAVRWRADVRPTLGIEAEERGRLLLQMIAVFGPTPGLQQAYFDNLDRILAGRPVLARPGRLVLGLGTGRCGSTSLTHLVASIRGACATHENPPLIHWRPRRAQIAMHVRRFARLRRHFSVVFDSAHWWLNAVPAVMSACPDAVFVGLLREPAATVASFLHMKGDGPGSLNHWVRPGAGHWQPSSWDAVYPDFPLSRMDGPGDGPAAGPADGALKAGLIGRYVREYQAALRKLERLRPAQTLLLATEALGDDGTLRRLYDFLGAGDGMFAEVRLNAGTISDGDDRYRF